VNRVLILIEKTSDGYGAFAPDVPGVGVVGDTREETEGLMRDALTLHFETLRDEGQPVPEQTTQATFVEVDTA